MEQLFDAAYFHIATALDAKRVVQMLTASAVVETRLVGRIVYLAGRVERIDVVLDGGVGGLVCIVGKKALAAGLALHYLTVTRATEQAGSV